MNRRIRVAFLLPLAGLLITASNARGQYAWLDPTGTSVWTAGTPHYVLWSGGPAGLTGRVSYIEVTNFTTAGTLANLIPNNGYTQFNIPLNQTPGPYQMYIEDPGITTWTYGPVFQIQAAPFCLPGCQQRVSAIATSQNACFTSQAQADQAATTDVMALLVSQCPPGATLSGVGIDLTPLSPFIACAPGFYTSVASATACCCIQGPIPAITSTWGGIKARER